MNSIGTEYNKTKKLFQRLQRTIQINQPTRCSNFSSLFLEVCLQLNLFQASSCPSSGVPTTAVAASGFTFVAW
jgi:hypothetical protein